MMKIKANTYGAHRFAIKSLIVAFCTYTSFVSLHSAEPVDNWAEYPRPVGAGAPTSIAFGNGVFVAVDGTSIIISTNGADWSVVTDPDIHGAGAAATRVRFVNDRFFVFGSANGGLMSTDGAEWTPFIARADPSGFARPPVTDITFANGAYYGVAGSQVLTSTDAVNWSAASGGGPLSYITYGGGKFVANGGTIPVYLQYSTDAQTWNATTAGSSFPVLMEITYQNGSFCTALLATFPPENGQAPVPLDGNTVLFSDDGVNWSYAFRFPEGSVMPRKVVVGGPYYVAAAGPAVYYTTNLVGSSGPSATNWIAAPLAISAPETQTADVAFGNNVFVAVSLGKIFKSNPISGVAPLRIVRQPASYTANVTGTASFVALAQGSDPITYQWRFNGTNIVGATNSTLVLTNLRLSAAGEYDAVITNPAGSVTTEKAVLSVHFAEVLRYAGVTLRGSVGDRFQLEYKDALESPETWHTVTNVTLTTPVSVWVDYDSVTNSNRFYRATYLGQ
jgi:hypothetical protein